MNRAELPHRAGGRTGLNIILGIGCAALAACAVPRVVRPEPLWAYGFSTAPAPDATAPPKLPLPNLRIIRTNEPVEEQNRIRTIKGSLAAYSRVDIRDGGNVADWFPDDHPPMTSLMSHGPASLGRNSWGCAYCHLPTGKGRPENAPVSGQPAVYFLRQLEDFRNGDRTSADPRKPNTPLMAALARAMSDEEMREAAAYFGAVKWTPWTRVVETDLVPTTQLDGNLFVATSRARTEPIAGRIIEVPEDDEQSEVLRNPRSGFVAYVPTGSIDKGETLVATGGAGIGGGIVAGRTLACAACHGQDLMGFADVPGIAGRSPSYLVRQLYDFQRGTRRGKSSPLMQPVVANLTAEDMVDIAAYLASRVAPEAAASR